jgi:serine phosphatase RsbU (regulator of sigma subunit)
MAKDDREGYLRLHHAAVFVRDQDRSLHFFVDQLGFNVAVDYHFGEQGRFILLTPPNGDALVALIAPNPESDEYKRIGKATGVVFVTENVPATFHAWRERGVHFRHPPQTPAWGGIFTIFEDPEGNSFVLAGWDDLTRQIETRRRESAERLVAERQARQEAELARQFQARLFPQMAPPCSTLDYSGICIQARAVGGDYYDFLNLGNRRLGLVVGDISGKGMAAALLMANLQANMRSQVAMASDQPELFLNSVNRLFYENTVDSAYATLFYAEYDDGHGRIRFANCGHLAALLLRCDGTLAHLESTCSVLGLFENWECVIKQCSLLPGDTLLLYTDGVTESLNDLGDEFGEQRLIEALKRSNHLPSQAMLNSIIGEIRQFAPHEQHDDITLIAAKCI